MSIDEHHVALPKLYGAPAYARPAGHRTETPRPFDPDELPIQASMTDDDRAIAASLERGAKGQNGDDADGRPMISARQFSIRGLAGRILKQDDSRV